MVETDYTNHILTAYIRGEIDHDSAARIRVEVDGAAQSLRPKPGMSASTARHPSPASSGSSFRQWNVLISGDDSSSMRLWVGVSGRTTLKCTRSPEKDRYRLSSVKGIHSSLRSYTIPFHIVT